MHASVHTQLELETMLDTTTIRPLFATASMTTQHPFSPSGGEVRVTSISGSDNSHLSPRSIESANIPGSAGSAESMQSSQNIDIKRFGSSSRYIAKWVGETAIDQARGESEHEGGQPQHHMVGDA